MVLYRYIAAMSEYRNCARKPECCPENKKCGRSVIRQEESARVAAFREKRKGEKVQEQYRWRGRVVEFCHAWIKSKLGLRQFHVRGLRKVPMEMRWACLTYNLQHGMGLSKLPTEPASC